MADQQPKEDGAPPDADEGPDLQRPRDPLDVPTIPFEFREFRNVHTLTGAALAAVLRQRLSVGTVVWLSDGSTRVKATVGDGNTARVHWGTVQEIAVVPVRGGRTVAD